VHDRAARGRVALELGEIEIEVVERALAYACGRIADRLEVVELGDAVRAALDEVGLELVERRLQVRIGELYSRGLFEAVGGELHA
jgi:hypothetical protein